MIAIEVNGEFLELPANVRIAFRLQNPLLGDDVVLSPGSGTYTFDLPGEDDSPHNARVLGNPDVLENPNGLRKFNNAQLYIDNIRFRKGQLIVRDATPGKITVNFNWGITQLSDEIRTRKLRDLLDETITISTAAVNKKIYLKPDTAVAPYRISVNGRQYEGASLISLASAISTDTTEPRATATVINTGTTPLGMTAPFVEIIPFTNPTDPLSPLHVDTSEDNGNATVGFRWRAEAFDPTAYRAQINGWFAAFATATPPNNKIKMPVVYNNNPYGETVTTFLDIVYGGTKENIQVNAHASGGILHNDANYGVSVNVPFLVRNVNSLQPFIRVKYVLDQIANWLGVGLEGDWLDADVENMLLDNSYALDVPMDFLGKKKFVFWRRSFNLRELVPDITAIDFLKALASRYNLGIYRSEKTGNIRLMKREAVALKLATVDITARAGRIQKRADERLAGIRLQAKREEKDLFATDDSYTVGDAEQTINTAISGIERVFVFTSFPLISRPFNEKFELRIFYYTGIQDVGGIFSQTASINAANYDEKFSGTNGLYEKRWKYWLHYRLRRRAIKMPIEFFLREMNRFDFESPVLLDRKTFLVSEIDGEVTHQGLGISDVELYTMF